MDRPGTNGIRPRSGPPPFGYMVASGRRVPNPREQLVLDRIRTLHASGHHDGGTAYLLNAEGLLPRRASWWTYGSVRTVRIYDALRRAEELLAGRREAS